MCGAMIVKMVRPGSLWAWDAWNSVPLGKIASLSDGEVFTEETHPMASAIKRGFFMVMTTCEGTRRRGCTSPKVFDNEDRCITLHLVLPQLRGSR